MINLILFGHKCIWFFKKSKRVLVLLIPNYLALSQVFSTLKLKYRHKLACLINADLVPDLLISVAKTILSIVFVGLEVYFTIFKMTFLDMQLLIRLLDWNSLTLMGLWTYISYGIPFFLHEKAHSLIIKAMLDGSSQNTPFPQLGAWHLTGARVSRLHQYSIFFDSMEFLFLGFPICSQGVTSIAGFFFFILAISQVVSYFIKNVSVLEHSAMSYKTKQTNCLVFKQREVECKVVFQYKLKL